MKCSLSVEEAAEVHASGGMIVAYAAGKPDEHDKKWLQPQSRPGASRGRVTGFRDTGAGWLIRREGGIGWEAPNIYDLRNETEYAEMSDGQIPDIEAIDAARAAQKRKKFIRNTFLASCAVLAFAAASARAETVSASPSIFERFTQALEDPLVPNDLRSGMTYEEARKITVAAGWQPDRFKKAILDQLDRDLQEWYITKGYYEIDNCAPTGDGLCSAVFHDARGNKFYIFATSGGREEGAFKPGGPRIVSFCRDLERVNCSAQ